MIWCNRYSIEHRPCTYIVYDKYTGRAVYNGKADDAYHRLAQCNYSRYIEGTFANIT
jgi:hypothetical protein